MVLDYDPLWDEQGQLRRGCTVREALAWLTKFGSHSAGERCGNGGADEGIYQGEESGRAAVCP